MAGGDSPDPPKPSAEERALQRTQTRLLREQAEREEMLFPVLAEQLGIDPQTGELTDLGERRQQLEETLLERQMAAARGELPVSSVIERDIQEQEQRLHRQLREQFGPGFETASPAIERMEEFRERANLTREQARRGMLVTAGDLLAQREGMAGSRLGDVMALQTAPGQIAQGFQMPISNLRSERGFQFSGQVAQHNAQASAVGGGASLGAQLGFMAGGPVGALAGGVGGALLGDIF